MYNYQHAHHSAHNNHHGGRPRRAPRLSAPHGTHKNFRAVRSPKEVIEPVNMTDFRKDFNLSRSFEDDFDFLPANLLTEDDMNYSAHSGSDRSSLSSNSPESSPLQQPTFVLSGSTSASFTPGAFMHQNASQPKLHQPLARSRNAIPIIDPSSNRQLSPPPSVSPARQMQQHGYGRRW